MTRNKMKTIIISLLLDEYVTDEAEIFDSFAHSNSMSFDEYINTHWEKHEYSGGSAELEKIRTYGDFFGCITLLSMMETSKINQLFMKGGWIR